MNVIYRVLGASIDSKNIINVLITIYLLINNVIAGPTRKALIVNKFQAYRLSLYPYAEEMF
jgi:hypothetical protein